MENSLQLQAALKLGVVAAALTGAGGCNERAPWKEGAVSTETQTAADQCDVNELRLRTRVEFAQFSLDEGTEDGCTAAIDSMEEALQGQRRAGDCYGAVPIGSPLAGSIEYVRGQKEEAQQAWGALKIPDLRAQIRRQCYGSRGQ
ncbi:MAG: hypothetical protein AAB606_03545 [Patescibacteria group bacterium]